MNTLLRLATRDGIRLTHDWYVHLGREKNSDCVRDYAGRCEVCDRGLNLCRRCGCTPELDTTHCALEPIGPLVSSLIRNAGLDYSDGTWRWKAPRVRFDRVANRIELLEPSGSIDRLITYADARCEIFRRHQPSDQSDRLHITIR